ncbi:hypothetical protein GIW45_26540 [Pseudomonas congelans]|uniref:GNAT family N-acetyltransferase n=1 Tax=Pseudomonas congelans TaxID=200452 RepID=UPI001F43A5D5|nr:GNAT family N-acetyltransferase [Pseudomonas congelans]MCF5167495.1 hypothetical protein [Pseudomonas congelans]
MPVPIHNLPFSALHSQLGVASKPQQNKGSAIAPHLVRGTGIRLSGHWLDQQRARLDPNQRRLLSAALNALRGHDAVEDICLNDLGGQFNLARPCYGATSVSFQRDEQVPDTLCFISVKDRQGNSMLTLGHECSTPPSSGALEKVPSRADDPSILANSRRDPNAAWQRTMFIVSFFTAGGEKAKVVGDYKKGDNSHFEVKDSTGQVYATLKRTQLDSGEHVWMLPEHASIDGGVGGSSSDSRARKASYVSDRQLMREAHDMLKLVESMNDPDEHEDHTDMLRWIATGVKEPGLVKLPESNIKLTANGRTVGLMTVAIDMKNKEGTTAADRAPAFWMDKVVALPGTRGNGKALLSKAIAMSEEHGYGGVVRAFVQSGHDFYESMGFEEIDGQIQELDPSGSPHWNKENGKWKFNN